MNDLRGPEVGYVDLLNFETTEFLKKEQADGTWSSKTPIRPSAAGKCTRELYYEMMQYAGKAKYETELKKPEVHRLLNLGYPVENHVVRQFEQLLKMVSVRYKQQSLSFFKIDAENNPALSQWVEGSLDLCFFSEKWKCVIDIKSKKDKFSSFRSTKWDEDSEKYARMKSVVRMSDDAFWVENLSDFLEELNDPFFEANFLQLNVYANAEFLKERGVDHAAIIQYNKNDSRLREVRFKPCPEVFARVRHKFESAVKAADTDRPELAPKDYLLGSVKCAFCSFKNECWKEDALKSFFKTMPAKHWPTDSHKLGETGSELEALFTTREVVAKAETEKERLEQDIIKVMTEADVRKLRLGNGDVYEVVHRKSPRPHFELKRSKV